MAPSASLTSSSLCGLMIASTSFMPPPLECHADRADHARSADVVPMRAIGRLVRIDILHADTQRPVSKGRANVPVGIFLADRQITWTPGMAQVRSQAERRLGNCIGKIAGEIDVVLTA